MAGIQFLGPFAALERLCAPAAAVDEEDRPRVPVSISQRFYYDPPEVLACAWFPKSSPRHWAYFTEDPAVGPLFLVESDGRRGNTFTPHADTLLCALHTLLTRTAGERAAVAVTALETAASAHGHDLKCKSPAAKGRQSAVLAPTLSGLGVIVPFDRKTEVGFRPLIYTRPQLLKLLNGVVNGNEANKRALGELRTFAHIANDECDFGNGLLLGLELWAFHPMFTSAAVEHLSMAYMLLNRAGFDRVLQESSEHRSACMGGPRLDVDSAIEVGSGAKDGKRKREP